VRLGRGEPRDDLRKGGFRGGLFFVFLFLSCLFRHQGCGVGGWGNFLASSRSFFSLLYFYFSHRLALAV